MEDQRDEIKQRIDIVDLINEYVPLKKRGSNYIGLCPFHNEKTPSFSVNPARGFFHCFGCHKGGDIFTFLMEIENIEFKEALEILAGRAGVTLKKSNFSYEKPEVKDFKERLLEVNTLAKDYYKKMLYDPKSKKVQDYVRERKINRESLEEFELGYSDGNVYEFLKRKGYTDKEIIESGLCYKRDDGKVIDRFWGRLIFPIKDIMGNVLAFGGRNLDKDSKYAKYINTSDTPIYNKGHHLFGLNLARQYCKEKLIIVEGYMDVLSLHQAGVKNAVAALGTALTDMQANLIKSRTKEVLTCYDSDEAGTNANIRGINVLHNKKIEARVIILGNEKDPDEYILKHGLTSFENKIDEAITGINFKIEVLKRNLNLDDPQDRIKFLKGLAKIIAEIPNRLEQDVYMEEAARKYKITKDSILLEVNKEMRRKKQQDEKLKKQNMFRENYRLNKEKENANVKNANSGILENAANVNISEEQKTIYRYMVQNVKREELVIYILLFNKEFVDLLKEKDILKYILNKKNKKTIKYILEKYEENPEIEIQNLITETEDKEIIENITKIGMNEIEEFKAEENLKDILDIFERQELNIEKDRITKKLNELSLILSTTTDENKKKEIEEEKNKLMENLRENIAKSIRRK